MSEMLERVVAVMIHFGALEEGATSDFTARKLARAAIATMREPDNDMEDVGANSLWHEGNHHDEKCEETVGNIWRAMIDEALK